MAKRRMDEELASTMYADVTAALARLENWQAEHSNVVDYRVNDALAGLRKAQRAVQHLRDDIQYREWYAAMEEFIKAHNA